MLRSNKSLLAASVLLALSFQTIADDNSDGRKPRISDILTTYSSDGAIAQITVKGVNLLGKKGIKPYLSIGKDLFTPANFDLKRASYTDTQITLPTLPANTLAKGDYLVWLSKDDKFSAENSDSFDFTIGAVGPQGPAGLKGDKGETGLQGIQGIKGDTGLTGAQGVKGDTGLTGAQGDTGDTGLTGAQGIQGVKGDSGAAGSSDAWGRLGNAGTVDGVNFIGTTDNVPLNFRVNNLPAGVLDPLLNATFFGIEAGSHLVDGPNYAGHFNTGLGYHALYSTTTGLANTASGYGALEFNTIGSSNSAFGYNALQMNTQGYNSAFGTNALSQSTIGYDNVAMGNSALEVNNGWGNTAIGVYSLVNNTVGSVNIAIGDRALNLNTSGSNNIAIGYAANVTSPNASNQVRIGNESITYAGIQVAWTITSDIHWKENIQPSNLGLAFVQQLKSVSYVRKNDTSKKLEFGFIAQDVEAVLNASGVTNAGMLSRDSNGMLSLRYNDLIAPMVKAIQEQQSIIESLKTRDEKQQVLIDDLTARLVKLEAAK